MRGAHQGVPKVPKWPQAGSPRINIGHFWTFGTPWWAPQGSSNSSINFYYCPWITSVLKQWKFVARLNWMEAKQKKYKIWAILAIFGPFGPPCWAPRGIRSHLSFSTTLSALDQCKNHTNFLPEWNGWWQNPKNSRFWSILATFGPLGPRWLPYGPLTLILELYHIFL